MIRNANQFIRQFILGQVDLETTLSRIQQAFQKDIEERALEEIKMRITEEIQRQKESKMRYSDTNTIPSMVRMYDPVSGKLIAEFPYLEGCSSEVNTNFSGSVILEPCWAWAGRRDDDALKSACSVKELLEQTQGEKDDKVDTVF